MKVAELFEASQPRREIDQVIRDAKVWRKLVNMPSQTAERLLNDKETQKTGLSQKDAVTTTKHGRSALRMMLRMRNKSVINWSTSEINFMYRQISAIKRLKTVDGGFYNDNKKPNRKLKSLWMWGNIPTGHNP